MAVSVAACLWLALACAACVRADNSTLDTCELDAGTPGPWSALLEEWTLTAPPYNDRHGRIMALPPTKGYYVSERIDGPLMPPPPPPPPHGPPDEHKPPGHHGPPGSPGPHGGPPPGPPRPHGLHSVYDDLPPDTYPPRAPGGGMPPPPPGPLRPPPDYNEWEPNAAGGKIVNRPNPYDSFRPSYAVPPQNYRPQRPAADRVDAPPRKQVSETDLYLLGAIEKLVYRVDLMEKRLRRMEENVHYLVAGVDAKPEPCAANFTRVGGACYHWSAQALDWKGANLACRKLRGALLELPDPVTKRQLLAAVLADKHLRGDDLWTGSRNPGLLWIWSHSARPVEGNSTGGTNGTSIAGEGRCLALAHDPAGGTYLYRGRDCALRQRYVCQKEEDKEKLSNDIQRAARVLKSMNDKKDIKIYWNNN
ncbi:PREDICTED: uncharacterized protein LOC106111188 [Papilio polytes]|uniref:uncharacterized protein LOC106111188 n=1 Tax=Papilio polytes TaxID=76194 RepID=UPI0006768222|nr:PREDICTED: uncharacterized protein LOC106111188 [Papilio polytes]XP_013148657.1 PREDICTED: uncharacterized protein LOC106111188 [Papilio polytes]XP_013148658.1 PREDICTED: uncharacterized protein LOC106111188 [Papilio polytes]XP_013148659.1 PREDICTED: uncharacterized protein LOC106111188 [Papilio polytes]